MTDLVVFLLPLAVKDWLQPGATFAAALIAICGVFYSTRQARRSARAAERSADAAQTSANAAKANAKSAQDAVGVNRETAAGVAKRAEADALAKRYQDAAAQLGHDKAAVRLAGAYAMARLADDWPDERQVCIDVLCSYLKMPAIEPSTTAKDALGEAQVRRSITEVFIKHWTAPTEKQADWSSNDFDFRGAELVDFWLEDVQLTGNVRLRKAHLHGRCGLRAAVIERGDGLNECVIHGDLSIRDSNVDQFNGISIEAGAFVFIRLDPDASTSFAKARVEGGLHVRIPNYGNGKGRFYLNELQVSSGGTLVLNMFDKHIEDRDPHREDQWAQINTSDWSCDEGGTIRVSTCLLESRRMIFDYDSVPEARIVGVRPAIRRLPAVRLLPPQVGTQQST